MTPQAHGGIREVELRKWGLAPSDVIDFSASVNPYGPSPLVRAAMRRVRLDRYPDPDCTELVEALSQRLSRPTDWILPGNGATELLHVAARAWSTADGVVAISPPTFGEYGAAAVNAGAPLLQLPPLDRALEAIERQRPALLFVCNPNNPTGELFPLPLVRELAAAMAPGVLLVDEAYVRFVPSAEDALPLLDGSPNLVLVRSMTKDYGLTALRLGYAVGRPERIAELRGLLPPWTVNGLAQAAGVAALQDEGHVTTSLERVQQARAALLRGLRTLGLELVEGSANFVMIDVGRAARVRSLLAQRGLLVRDCQSFDLPRYIRVAVRRPGENRRLIAALRELVERGELGNDDGSTIRNIDE